MERQIIVEVTKFFESPLYRQLSKQKNKVGSKLRLYKGKNEKGKLTAKAALNLLLDLELVEEINFK